MLRLSALLAALVLAAPARAQAFDARAAAGVMASLKAARPPQPPALPASTPKEDQRLFADGWREAVRALARKDCQRYFAEHGAPAPKPLDMMRSTEYAFYALRQGPGVGAQTNGPGSVFINTTGLFVTAQDGEITLNGRRYDLYSPSGVRAMILLHELGHELGIFGADSGPELRAQNAQHSRDIIDACVSGRLVY